MSRVIWPAGERDLGGGDNASTRIPGDLIVRLPSGELAGTGECRPDIAGFFSGSTPGSAGLSPLRVIVEKPIFMVSCWG